MPIFFISNTDIEGNTAFIKNKSDLKHISNVLRAKVGENIELISENKEILTCKITKISKEIIETNIIKKEISNKFLKLNINLALSILKTNAQDFTIQKATELGVNTITPLLTRYSVPSFKTQKDKDKKVTKWQIIANESCKQCERASFPVINNITTISDFISNINAENTIVCVERNANLSFRDSLKDIDINNCINIIIGPEGGWSNEELALFKEYNLKQTSLGNLILRAETAAIKAISNVIYEYED